MAEHFPPVDSASDDDVVQPQPETDEQPWWRLYFLAGLAGFVVLVLGSLAAYMVARDTMVSRLRSTTIEGAQLVTAEPIDQDELPRFAEDVADTRGAKDLQRLQQLRESEDLAIRLSKLERFIPLRDQANQDLDHLATEMASWNNLMTTLLDGDGGKRIASDTAYVERFLSVYEAQHVTQQQYESFQRRFMTLSGPVDKAKKDSSYLPSDDLLTELRTLQGEVSAALAQLASARKDAEAVQRFAASRPLSDKTLRAAIDDFEQQQQQTRLAQIAESKRKAEAETTAILAEQQAAQEKLQRDIELARLARENAKLGATKDQLDAEAKAEEGRRIRAAQKAALVRQFDAEYPAMKAMLTPFTTAGTRQPTTSFQYIDTGERKPVSFGALQRLGYLENSPQNRLYFAKYVTALNNRPAGSFPNLSLDAGGGHEKIRKIQEFLQKYGEIMVDKNLLSP